MRSGNLLDRGARLSNPIIGRVLFDSDQRLIAPFSTGNSSLTGNGLLAMLAPSENDDAIAGVPLQHLLDWFSAHDELNGYTLEEVIEPNTCRDIWPSTTSGTAHVA